MPEKQYPIMGNAKIKFRQNMPGNVKTLTNDKNKTLWQDFDLISI